MAFETTQAFEYRKSVPEIASTSMPTRVLLLVSNLHIGGAQEIVRTLAETLPQAGCQVVVGTFEDGELRREIEKTGVAVEILPSRRHSVLALPLFLLEILRIRRSLLQIVDKYQIQVIQTQLLRSLDFLVLSLRLTRPLLVFWTFHNAQFVLRSEHLPRFRWLLGVKRWLHSLLYRLSAPHVHGYIAVSEDVRKAVHAYAGPLQNKVSVILNSVDVQRYQGAVDRIEIRQQLGVPVQSKLIAVVATFKKQKGHHYLIEAVSALIEKHPELHILFIGDGELKPDLQEMTRKLGLVDHIHFLGLRKDVPALLGASDFFVLPSLWEGLPMALIEAMATGLPVIATQVSGTKDVMLHLETGLLVQPGDAEQLSQAILQILSDPEDAKRMGDAGKSRVTEFFSAENQAQSHVKLYQEQWNLTFRKGL